MSNLNNIIPKRVILSSILLGIFLNLACIAVYLFPSVGGGTDSGGVLGTIYIVVIAAIIIVSFTNLTSSLFSTNKYTWVSIIYILGFYYYSITVYPEPRTPFNLFVVFSIVSMTLPSIVKVDIRWVLLAIMFSTIPALLHINTIFFSTEISYTSDDILSQGYSYAFLTPVVSTIVYIKYFWKLDTGKNRVIINIAIIINLLFTYFLIKLGSRGPVLALISLIAIPYIFDVGLNMQGVRVKKMRTLYLVILMVFLALFFVPILTAIQNMLSEFNLSMHFIDKFLIRNEVGDITSERTDIFDMAMNGFYNHPWIGNGFDQFYNNTGRGYPHNFITQTLYDGGILLFSITILPVSIYLKKWFRDCSYNEYIIILALFFVSVPGALFSHDLWEIGNLWFFYGAVLNYKKLVHAVL